MFLPLLLFFSSLFAGQSDAIVYNHQPSCALLEILELFHVDHEATLPINETEMAKLLFAQLDLPPSWNGKVIFIDTPRPQGKIRPNTKDTFHYCLYAAVSPKRRPYCRKDAPYGHLY